MVFYVFRYYKSGFYKSGVKIKDRPRNNKNQSHDSDWSKKMVANYLQVVTLSIVALDTTLGFSPSFSTININSYGSIASSRMQYSMFGHASTIKSIQHTASTPPLLAAAGNTIANSDSLGVTLNRRAFFMIGAVFPIFLSSLPSHAENVSSAQPVSIHICKFSFCCFRALVIFRNYLQPSISLVDFYAALRNQEVESVEFDGAMYEVRTESLADRVPIIFLV